MFQVEHDTKSFHVQTLLYSYGSIYPTQLLITSLSKLYFVLHLVINYENSENWIVDGYGWQKRLLPIYHRFCIL